MATVLSKSRQRVYQSSRDAKPLKFEDGPLVWIDCEMTGLNPQKDRILEVAVLISDGNLNIVDEGIGLVVRTERAVLDRMDTWCRNTHQASGLTNACIKSRRSASDVETAVLKYVRSWIPDKGSACLAGNSVHADKAFLDIHMPSITNWLHYRIVDVSTVKELHRRWFADRPYPKQESKHRALDDIRGSIDELKWYRENTFIQS
ncbi:ribonuclease H-like domain-containing protein [Vararia minispora EC-137]|uniref:Ribonuclease H-like domain-containing protein n=1 Tax=Vararia minispora EC-137 TaxID=1314806 RepID=A0ACB8QS75_9AGAM|nr:ribonuclease H-like domain-containing protein [Vararia minispora EC-137]